MITVTSTEPPVFPIQPAKIQRPPLRDETLQRDRLLDWLAAKIHHRAVFVVAEAGYGKTTLLADFSRRTRLRTMWYRLDADDRDPVAFLNYLVAAGRQLEPGFAPATAAMLRDMGTGSVSHDTLVATFVRELQLLGSEGAVLIVDDYHLVDDAPDVRSIVRAVLAGLPERLTVVLLSRRRPLVPIARLRAQGELAELTTEDLRFRTDETERLFRERYRRPLEPDVLDELSRRTEGWAASLQLVRTALRDRSPGEVRAFVRGLSGTHEELYDYLAEEVVGELDEATREFLMRTAILQVVEPDLATVLTGADEDAARRSIEACELIGLLGRRGESRWSHRYHPLVQEFLLDRLTRAVGLARVQELHRAVARHAEARDWRLAAHHWAAAGDGSEVQRILASAIAMIMGTGEYALAESYLDRFPAPTRTPVFEVFLSRLDFYRNQIDAALSRARWAVESISKPTDGLALVNLASLEFMAGNVRASAEVVGQLESTIDTASVSDIAEGMVQIIESGDAGDLDVFGQRLERILKSQLARGETHYAGVTALNLAIGRREQGLAQEALRFGNQAVDLLVEHALGPELSAAYALRAWAHAHLGDIESAEGDLNLALGTSHQLARAEVQGEAADLYAWYDDIETARDLVEQARLPSQASRVLSVSWRLASAEVALRLGDHERALALLSGLAAESWFGTTGQHSRIKTLTGYAALVAGRVDGEGLVRSAMEHALGQKAYFWASYSRLLLASRASPDGLRTILHDFLGREPAFVHILAEQLAGRLGDLDSPAIEALTAEIQTRPRRWWRPLRAMLEHPESQTRLRAARILDRVGDSTDIARLRHIARTSHRTGTDGRLGKGLARRLAMRVSIEDLGRTQVRLGDETIPGTSIRRKVLALLLYLVSRPGMSATRDQVLEAMWPDLGPREALNSLNQTLYFLRRVFEPDFDEEVSPEYLHHHSDLVWLDPELVTSRSGRCQDLLTLIAKELRPEWVERLTQEYTAQFALDFSYDDWAAHHRDLLHSSYLEAVERSVLADIDSGDFARAIRHAARAIEIDPSVEPLHLLMIRLCRAAGAHAAAAERYAIYASLLRDELGVEPPTLESL